MTIYRPFQTQDAAEVIGLMTQLGYEFGVDTLISRIADIRKNRGEVIVAEHENKIVGCVNMIIDIRLAEGTTGEIVSLIVTKESRGTGLGKGLVDVAEQWLQARCTHIRVRANTVRHKALKFYQSHGFTLIKSQQVLIKKI